MNGVPALMAQHASLRMAHRAPRARALGALATLLLAFPLVAARQESALTVASPDATRP